MATGSPYAWLSTERILTRNPASDNELGLTVRRSLQSRADSTDDAAQNKRLLASESVANKSCERKAEETARYRKGRDNSDIRCTKHSSIRSVHRAVFVDERCHSQNSRHHGAVIAKREKDKGQEESCGMELVVRSSSWTPHWSTAPLQLTRKDEPWVVDELKRQSTPPCWGLLLSCLHVESWRNRTR